MRKIIATATCILALVVVISGCASGSNITFGPVTAKSRIGFHEWRESKFYTTDTCVGSTFGFTSSEICGESHECNGASIGAWTNWNRGEDHFIYPKP